MKKTILLTILIIFSFNNLTAQQTITDTEKLVSLGKMYGFLKYYHPEVGQGKYDWDNQLIEYIPKVLNATDKKSLSTIYINWIDQLGKIEKCRKCDSDENYFDKNFNLSWTKNSSIFDNSLISRLDYIEQNRIQGENFYVDIAPVGNIKVTNEPIYNDFDYPSEEYRLLGLFKYWNIIEYFYPYKYLTDQKWDSVLEEMIPKFRLASNEKEYKNLIQQLITKLDDSHVAILIDDKPQKYLPAQITNIENKPVITGFYNDSIAATQNLKLGDIILKINEIDISSLIEKNLKLVPGSNSNIKTRHVYYKILGGEEENVKLTIEREGQIKQLNVKRYDFQDFNYSDKLKAIKTKEISDEIGYINMQNVEGKDIADIFKSFENKESIIIDLRNYPAFIYKLFSRYLNSEKRDFTKIYSPNINYPGRFIYKENLQTRGSKKAYKGKVILLVNDKSISRSEFTAMAFQTADNVITVGNQTAGADGDIVRFDYLGGFTTSISGNGILYPDGSETQRKGVKIDIEVCPTIDGLRLGRDEILEKAIELAND